MGKEEEQTNYLLLAIVGIVGIVAILAMYQGSDLGTSSASNFAFTEDSPATTAVGEAFKDPDSQVTDTLRVGETDNYVLGGDRHEIYYRWGHSSLYSAFRINGEYIGLRPGDTKRLNDGGMFNLRTVTPRYEGNTAIMFHIITTQDGSTSWALYDLREEGADQYRINARGERIDVEYVNAVGQAVINVGDIQTPRMNPGTRYQLDANRVLEFVEITSAPTSYTATFTYYADVRQTEGLTGAATTGTWNNILTGNVVKESPYSTERTRKAGTTLS